MAIHAALTVFLHADLCRSVTNLFNGRRRFQIGAVPSRKRSGMGIRMSKIAVYFPGIGYHCDKPLLYYARETACETGYKNYRALSYPYMDKNIRGNEEKMRETYEALLLKAEEQLSDIVWAEYDDVLFVSKSVGTIIAASYAKKYGIACARHVLYTPLIQTFSFEPGDAEAFIGTADPWSNVDEIIRLSGTSRIPLNVYEGCNHSLECGDLLRNLEIIKEVMQKTKDFCERKSWSAGKKEVQETTYQRQ